MVIYDTIKNCNNKTLKKVVKLDNWYNETIKQILHIFLNHRKPITKIQYNKTKIEGVKLPYANESILRLNVNKEINRKEIKSLLNMEENENIEVTYTYNKNLGQQIYNYNKFLKQYNDPSELLCLCNNTEYKKFVHHPIGHIVNGDLNLILNEDLRNLFSKGMKHRLSQDIDVDSLKNHVKNELNRSFQNIGKKKKSHQSNIQQAINIVYQNISKNWRKIINPTIKPNNYLHDIKELQNKFIITPVDKATTNACFSCKKFYFNAIKNELNQSNNKCAYKVKTITTNDILHVHKQLLEKYKVKTVHDDTFTIPILYGIPKLHKLPHKYRYIAGAHNSSLKPLSIILLNALKHIKTHFKNYCRIIEKRANKKIYLSIDSSQDLANSLLKLGESIHKGNTFDFSTLYTELVHETILENLCNNNINNNNTMSLTITVLKELTYDVLKETFIQFNGTIYQQNKGVPMGGNASPLIADLTLSYMEYKYYNNNCNQIAKNTMIYRYIDDILALNTDITNEIRNIYGPTLIVNKENFINNKLNYLDMSFELNSKNIGIYDKTDDYKFNVIKGFDISSCIHPSVAKGMCNSQIHRYCKITNNRQALIAGIQRLRNIMNNNNFQDTKILKVLLTYYNKNHNTFWKFKIFTKKELERIIVRPIWGTIKR
jgi:hypothetical protein